MTSSDGKTLAVTPSSAPMFVMRRPLGDASACATPGPPYSITQPTLPLVVRIERTLRMTSLAVDERPQAAGESDVQTFGAVR